MSSTKRKIKIISIDPNYNASANWEWNLKDAVVLTEHIEDWDDCTESEYTELVSWCRDKTSKGSDRGGKLWAVITLEEDTIEMALSEIKQEAAKLAEKNRKYLLTLQKRAATKARKKVEKEKALLAELHAKYDS